MAHSNQLQTLSDWLEYIELLHSVEIELGLTRVAEVFTRLFPASFSCRVLTVGGTNGKGSTCTFIEEILIEAGYSCGKNTSPHIHEFNERISVNGITINDDSIVEAFQKVEHARGELALTYFEYTFLAALVIFDVKKLDFAICEVGLGGRLDAVNILSPEVSVITNIGLDHIQWLGDTRELIALEKVAISRPNKLCIVGDKDFPKEAVKYLKNHQVLSMLFQEDYNIKINANDSWEMEVNDFAGIFSDKDKNLLTSLPLLSAPHQFQNASCAILAVLSLKAVEIEKTHINSALKNASVIGRCQVISEVPLIIMDVAHNVDSVKALSAFVESKRVNKPKNSKTIAVCSMLDDKDIENSLSKISQQIDEWWIAPLEIPRAAPIERIYSVIQSLQPSAKVTISDSINTAFLSARTNLESDDCLLVFGSFFVVGDILRHHNKAL